MNFIAPLARAVAIAGVSLAGSLVAAPVSAGPAELALLESYVGTWSGRGQLSGARTETVVCRMTLSPGNGDKVNYRGRCAMAGNTVSVNGTIAYVDAARRYEAAMTTNAGFTGIAIGRRSGDGIVFNMREAVEDEAGSPITVAASMTLDDAKIVVDFGATFNETGESFKAMIPFSK